MGIKESYNDKLIRWSYENDGQIYLEIDQKIDFLGKHLFFDYEPCFGPHPTFRSRFQLWLENLDNEEEQKLLFKLVPKLLYLGREEFNCLHKTAFNHYIQNWIMEKEELYFEDVDFINRVSETIKTTWFCPVTDSFRINQFYHINHIKSIHTFRPEWRSLKKFGNDGKIKDYLVANKVKYMILLEDFCGSGGQAYSPIKYACELFKSFEEEININILFTPLIVCATGHRKFLELAEQFDILTYKPIVVIPENETINSETINPDWSSHKQLIQETFSKVKGSSSEKELAKIEEFGYKNTGALIVMYTNTPNNSLPLIYMKSDSWYPLFIRHFRD